jgi:hypothetical protein
MISVALLLLLSCAQKKTLIREKLMPAFGTVNLVNVKSTVESETYRKFLRSLKREAPMESLAGSNVDRFEIPVADDFERWMVVVYEADNATYTIEGQILSPDLFSPTDQVVSFVGRIAFSSASFDDAPLDIANSRDAFELIKPLLESLSQRVGDEFGFNPNIP